jgi:hypothetical protein
MTSFPSSAWAGNVKVDWVGVWLILRDISMKNCC